MAVSAPPKTGSGYVGLMDYINANRDAINNTSGNLADTDAKLADDAKSAADRVVGQITPSTAQDPTQISGFSDAQNKLNSAGKAVEGLSTFGGLSQQLQDSAKGNYAAGSRALDANMIEGADPTAIKNVQGRYGGLEDYLNQQVDAWQAPRTAPRPSGPPTPFDTEPTVGKSGGATPAGEVFRDYDKPTRRTRFGPSSDDGQV